MKQINAKIVQNKKIAPGFYNMRIETPYLAKSIKPGQFVEVKCSKGSEVLLRRPLGCHKILKNGIEMLYAVVGKGTELLSHRKAGEMIDIIGPLGNGFTLNASAVGGSASGGKRYPLNAILIAGGIGVAPLLALAEALVGRKKIYVLIGAKTKAQILCKSDFEKLGAKVIISTEDGSQGKRGLITDCLRLLLQTPSSKLPTIFACGPTPMLKEVAYIAKENQIPCQVSLEEHMACGVGVCLGCPVKVKTQNAKRKTQNEYKMVCKDGPVFNSEEITW